MRARRVQPPAAAVPKSETLGDRLVRAGIVTSAQIEEALEAQVVFGGRIGTALMELGYVDEKTITRYLAEKLNVPPFSESLLEPEPDENTLAAIPIELVEKYHAIPLRREGRRLHVLMEDPSSLAQLDDLSFRTGLIIKPCVAAEARVAQLLERYYGFQRSTRLALIADGGRVRPAARAEDLEARRAAAHDEDLLPESVHATLMSQAGLAPPPEFEGGRIEFEREISQTEAPLTALAAVRTREDVARILLDFAGERFARAVLLSLQGDFFLGWDARGADVNLPAVRRLKLDADAPSILRAARDARAHFVAPIPKPPGPIHAQLFDALGGGAPKGALFAPVLVLDRVVCLLYADDGPGAVGPEKIAGMLEVLRGVPLAFAVLLRQRKALVR
jgi:hypothetical protein